MLTFILIFLIGCSVDFILSKEEIVDYTGHKVIAVIPQKESDVNFIRLLRNKYNVDLWNERAEFNSSVLMRLTPSQYETILVKLSEQKIQHITTISNLQSAIDEEKKIMFSPAFPIQNASSFDFTKYNRFEQIEDLLKDLSDKHPDIAKLEIVGQSYEDKPIYAIRISSKNEFGTKPAIMIECGIHAREWISVATGVYIINQLITKYGSDEEITSLVDRYEFYIMPAINPDGYIHSYLIDRMWRKTRSINKNSLLHCRGVDANRNFDIEHCGVGSSNDPCDEKYCGDLPFSESEIRAEKNLLINIGKRMKAYFAIHSYSQFWMTPYGTTKSLPENYKELERVGLAGTTALSKKHGTQFQLGSIANIIYEAAGSSVDYAYIVHDVKIAFALELRDTGTRGYLLPPDQIIPTCEETLDGIMGAILAMN